MPADAGYGESVSIESRMWGVMRNRGWLYRFMAALMVTTAMAASSAATASVTAEASGGAAARCAQVTFDGVKGSGEGSAGGGMGTTVAALDTAFKADLNKAVSTTAVPVAYPAVPVLDALDDGVLSGVNYPTSVARGVTALSDLVSRQLKTCTSTRVVLAGYSQGADVVETYLASPKAAAVRDRIAAVGLLGDPRFNPSDDAVDAGSFTPSYGPLFGKFGIPPNWTHPEGQRPAIPAPLSTRTISVCDKGDPICNYSWSNVVGCIGINAWKSFYASILAHAVVPVPELRASCAHFHYADAGSARITPGAKATVTAAAAFLAARAEEAPWTAARAPLPHGASGMPAVSLGPVACASARSCVAIGQYYDAAGNTQGLLERLSGTTWTATRAPVPAGASADPYVQLTAVTCPSASSCVAVGSYTDSAGSQGLVETLTGATWTATKLPQPARAAGPQVELASVACATASSCVAAGSYTDSSDVLHALLAARSGTAWTATTAPQPPDAATPAMSYLDSVACTRASSCLAAGSYNDSSGRHEALLETLSGTTWTPATAPPPADADYDPEDILYSVACPSASACAGAGYYTNSAGHSQGMLETLSGTTWTPTTAPLPADAAGNPQAVLYQAVCPSAAFCAAVGYYQDASGSGQGLLLTRPGATWTATKAQLPADPAADPYVVLSAVACPTVNTCVAVGTYEATSGSQEGLLETLAGSGWTAALAPVPADAVPQPSANLDSVACPSASWCAAAGSYTNASGSEQGLLLTSG
jgi:hypothetical protein